MDALAALSAVEAARKARQGEILAVDLVDAALERISALNGRLAAFMTVTEAGARRTAKRLDALPAAQRGPLHGLPIAFKDLIATAGVRTTYGSLVYLHNVPAEDEIFVSRVLKAGGVMIGKTTTPEFGYGALCQNRLAGPHRKSLRPHADKWWIERWLGGGGVHRDGGNYPWHGFRRLLSHTSES